MVQFSKEQLTQALLAFNIKELNEMQVATIDACEQPRDIILHSATGSGKTLAFLLPLWKILQPEAEGVQAIIIVPSRELALQIDDVFRKLATGYKVTLCYGGHKREIEETNLIQAPAIIIGTPGRISDHLRRGNFNPNTIKTCILDEFDKSLELGFLDEMNFIIGTLKNLEKRILTSATNAVDVPDFIGLKEPLALNFLTDEKPSAEKLAYYTVLTDDKDKLNSLFHLICYLGNRSTIIFCNHRDAVERTSQLLTDKGILNVFYHGGMEQQERDVALCKFRNGTSSILVTTDLASRGLDIPNIRYIIHYHLPMSEEVFTHRNGRTARIETSGTIYTLHAADEELPEYITANSEEKIISTDEPIPEKPDWSTLFVAAGKKDKINKIDIVGFLSHQGNLKKEDIGLIEVKDYFSFVAVRKVKVGQVLHLIKDERIKNKKVKIALAK